MGLPFIRSDHLEFAATEQAGHDAPAETEGVPMEGRLEDFVTAFVSVEADLGDLPRRNRHLPTHVSQHPTVTVGYRWRAERRVARTDVVSNNRCK